MRESNCRCPLCGNIIKSRIESVRTIDISNLYRRVYKKNIDYIWKSVERLDYVRSLPKMWSAFFSSNHIGG